MGSSLTASTSLPWFNFPFYLMRLQAEWFDRRELLGTAADRGSDYFKYGPMCEVRLLG
jgi:hypothetical protein